MIVLFVVLFILLIYLIKYVLIGCCFGLVDVNVSVLVFVVSGVRVVVVVNVVSLIDFIVIFLSVRKIVDGMLICFK